MYILAVPILALTATADDKTQKVVCRELMMKNQETIVVSPHRENLRFSIMRYAKEEIHKSLDWLVKTVKKNGVNVSKTIIFCNTITEMSVVINFLVEKLGKYAYYPPTTKSTENLLIGTYRYMT